MTLLTRNIEQLRERINTACLAAGRPANGVALLAVSKTFGPDAVIAAMASGQRAFGENYITEGVEKILTLRKYLENNPETEPLEWHCIGPVQSNKTRLVAEHFDWMESLDRLKIAQRLNDQRPADLPPLQVCLQVNIDGGANKSGVVPADTLALAIEVAMLPRLRLRGLMAIPEPAADFAAACTVHGAVKVLFDAINASGQLAIPMDTLSLGMSGDMEAAIHSGSTVVRVGTAIFGRRQPLSFEKTVKT
jgi:hypothetical protein